MDKPFKLNEFEDGNMKVTEYTKDGVTVSHTVKTPIPQELPLEEPKTTIEEQILAESFYQTALLEMQQMLGGM